MTIDTYIVTLRHDKGRIALRIVSLSGEEGAIKQAMAAEGCPRSAIIKTRKIEVKTL